MDIIKGETMAALRARIQAPDDLWERVQCPVRCTYLADGVDHRHEHHKDGSRAVLGWWQNSDEWTLLEFQGTLGF